MTGIEPWASGAAETLRTLGFTLVNSDHPAETGESELLVALRAEPTLRHFDPELIRWWAAAEGRGRPFIVDRGLPAEEHEVLWGHIHVVDRLGVENRFLTFGGHLRVADVTPALRVVEHASPGPVVRWGGHSQGSDPLAGEIGAFFGRLILPVDFVPGAEARVSAEPALHLYAAFLLDRTAGHLSRPKPPNETIDATMSWLHAEASRISVQHPVAWAAGQQLLGGLGLAG